MNCSERLCPEEMFLDRPFKLKCSVQHYAWGKQASDSLISRLVPDALNSDGNLPYAELWMGAHRSAPAQLCVDGNSFALDALIAQYPKQLLGQRVLDRFGMELPFLLKVLSIRRALSIQAHPDKSFAEKLHSKDPKHYPDANHKPEVAIALTPVELLYGFRSLEEIQEAFLSVPEFGEVVGTEVVSRLSTSGITQYTQALLQALFSQEASLIKSACLRMYQRLREKSNLREEERWILKLSEDYPEGDVGLFAFFFMNLYKLTPKTALYIAPNMLHAYLQGELVECMANSDNVVRAGLTPKYRDVAALLPMLDSTADKPQFVTPTKMERTQGGERFDAPVDEFILERFEGTISNHRIMSRDSLFLLFCLEGEGLLGAGETEHSFSSGDVYFVPASVSSFEFSLHSGVLFSISVP